MKNKEEIKKYYAYLRSRLEPVKFSQLPYEIRCKVGHSDKIIERRTLHKRNEVVEPLSVEEYYIGKTGRYG